MKSLKNNLNKYQEAVTGVRDYFKIRTDIPCILDLTEYKWYPTDLMKVIVKEPYGYCEYDYCANDRYDKPYYTLIISNGRSVILDNKKKSDQVNLYIEDGK